MKKAWLYSLDQPFEFSHPRLAGVDFKNEWVTISDSKMVINTNYAWDGCSPKYHILGLFVIGVPDGILRHGKPWTYYASLVHDVLSQFRDVLQISKSDSVTIFNDVLESEQWPLRKLYVGAVDYFGPQDWLL